MHTILDSPTNLLMCYLLKLLFALKVLRCHKYLRTYIAILKLWFDGSRIFDARVIDFVGLQSNIHF